MKPQFRIKRSEFDATFQPDKGTFLLDDGTEVSLPDMRKLFVPVNGAAFEILKTAAASPPPPAPAVEPDPRSRSPDVPAERGSSSP